MDDRKVKECDDLFIRKIPFGSCITSELSLTSSQIPTGDVESPVYSGSSEGMCI